MAILNDFITRGITDIDTLRDAIVSLILENNNDGSPTYPALRRGMPTTRFAIYSRAAIGCNGRRTQHYGTPSLTFSTGMSEDAR